MAIYSRLMETRAPAAKLHSAEFFGEQRDFWWNDDFVALMAKRLGLGDVRMALDVGSGVGHWGRVILPHLPEEARLFGIDREPAWVKEAAERASRAGLGDRVSYRLGEAQAIPFHDGVFDLVTCQTVLIHVRDPRAVMREMMRVTKPGGLLLMVEPNNMANALVLGSTQWDAPTSEIVDVLRLYLVGTRGKAALGEGHDSIGEMIPGYASEIGLQDIQVHMSDRPAPLFPPYAGPAQEVLRKQMLDWDEQGFVLWGREATRRYFLAGGGTEAELDRLWGAAAAWSRKIAESLRKGTEHLAGGCTQYLVSGRKPG
jgi:SAM-dependent methyltransferase